MRPSRGGSRGKTTSRGGLRSADNSGDESTGRKSQRRVRFQDQNSNPSSTARTATTTTTTQSSSQRTQSQNPPRRGTPNQRQFNDAVTRAARSSAALSRSFGSAPNPAAANLSGSSTAAAQSFPQRYQNLKKTRERERQEAIANGFLADPDKPRTLAEAITPVGTCPDMCPEFERVERVVQNDVWGPELESDASPDGQTSAARQQPDESRMVKKFRRAAAGIDEQLPSDLRPPQVLQKTIDYLFNDLLENSESLAAVHHFIWDRTRAIRNDFSIQQITKVAELRIAIDCYERIARFHILSLHQLALPEKPYDKYDAQQEREQLDKTLLSLMQYYDDSRDRLQSPNEPEFRAYCVIFQIQDPIPDLEDRVQTWPQYIANDQRVRRALDLYAAACNVDDVQGPLKPLVSQPIAQGNWARFWRLVQSKEFSYLMSCVAEIYFPLVRRIALNSIWTAFRAAKRSIEDWTLDELVLVLGFEDADEVESFCEKYGFTIRDRGDGMAYLDLESVSGRTLPDPAPGTRMQSKSHLVERKRHHRMLSAVISGMSVRAAREAGMIEEYVDQDEEMVDEKSTDEKSLFITGDSDDEETQTNQHPIQETRGLQSQKPDSSNLNPFATAWSPGNSPANSLFANTSALSSKTNEQQAPNQDQATKATPVTTNVSASFQSFEPSSKQPEQPKPQETQKPTAFAQNQTPSNAGQGLLFETSVPKATDNSESTQTSEKAVSASETSTLTTNPFKPTLDNSTILNTLNKDDQPFSFLRAKTAAANEESKSLGAPSLFAGTKTAPSFAPFPSNKTPTTTTSQDSTSTPSLFAKTSDNKAPPVSQFPNPNPAFLQIPKFGSFTQTPSTPFAPFNSQPSLPATSTSTPLSTASEQSKLPTFQFANVSQPKTSSPPPSNFPPQTTNPVLSQDKSASLTAQVPQSLQSQVKSPQQIAQERAADKIKKSATLDQLAKSLISDPSGFLDQYIEFTVAPMIKAARQLVADEHMRKKADDFRLTSISKRYARKWREISWGRRVARQGRERRQRMAREQDARARRSRESSISSILDEFKQSINGSTSGTALTQRVAASQPAHPHQDNLSLQTRSSITAHQRVIDESQQQSRSQHHRRSESAPNRSAILQNSRPPRTSPNHGLSSLRNSFLPGDSSPMSYQPPPALRSDTTRSTYFRLKAMGIDPSGLARASDRKRPRSSDSDLPSTASPGKKYLTAAGATSPARQSPVPKQPPSVETPKPAVNDEDEDLFAAVRQARQAMSDSISFFKDEIAKDEEMARSVGNAGSPPLGASLTGTGRRRSSGESRSTPGSRSRETPPAYRNRISKFLPRERYADVRMQQQKRSSTEKRNEPDVRENALSLSGRSTEVVPRRDTQTANPFQSQSQSQSSMFTPDASLNSTGNLDSAAPQLNPQPPTNNFRPSSQIDPSLTNGSKMTDYHGLNNVVRTDGKSNGQFTHQQNLYEDQSQTKGTIKSQIQDEGSSHNIHEDETIGQDDDTEDDEMDHFEAEPSNPQRTNAFGLLSSMAMDEDGSSDEDDGSGVEDEQSYSDDEEEVTDDEEEGGQESTGSPPARGRAPPAPKVTFNGKGGTSVEDAIEL